MTLSMLVHDRGCLQYNNNSTAALGVIPLAAGFISKLCCCVKNLSYRNQLERMKKYTDFFRSRKAVASSVSATELVMTANHYG